MYKKSRKVDIEQILLFFVILICEQEFEVCQATSVEKGDAIVVFYPSGQLFNIYEAAVSLHTNPLIR